MPRNGSGSFNLVTGNPFVPSTVISSSTMNNTMSDIATGLTQSIANDGQTTPVANLPMATFRHTNVGNALNRTDYAAAGQVQDGALMWLTAVAGTNTITASLTPSPGAYVAGQTFRFTAAGANTGAVTLNINGLGAKAITKFGTTALVSGDIASGQIVEVVYDGTQFQFQQGIASGTLIGVQVFTANGTYTPTAGTRSVIVECQGGGGAGGGNPPSGAGQVAVGAPGTSGAYGRGRFTSAFSGVSVTVGAGGTGVAGASGNSGAASSFGALLSAPGGTGGGNSGLVSPPFAAGTQSTALSTGGTIVNSPGGAQAASIALSTGVGFGGAGGASYFGAGGSPAGIGNNGAAAGGKGAGGGGTMKGELNSNNLTGGAGGAGLVIVYEYS